MTNGVGYILLETFNSSTKSGNGKKQIEIYVDQGIDEYKDDFITDV